jgi:rubrerythrin
MTTKENLEVAFGGESQAYQKYSAFAQKAQQDGFENIAKLFRTTAEAERIHALGHLKAMEKIGSTFENLQSAIGGETYEFEDMYPPMYEQALKENHKAKKMFGYALEAEKVHAELYKKALEAVKEGKDLDEVNIYLCPICGFIEIGSSIEKCPVCGANSSAFIEL